MTKINWFCSITNIQKSNVEVAIWDCETIYMYIDRTCVHLEQSNAIGGVI